MFWGHQRPSEAIRGHQRPSEAIWGRLNLSFLRIFKSLFEGVPDIRLGLYFVWLALFTSQFSWACFWGQGRVHSEATRSFSRPFWDQGYIWHHDTWWSHLPIIYGSLLSLRLLWGCSRLPITIINSVWEYSSRSIELIFCVVGSFYTTIFMSIFFRPRSTPKQVTEGHSWQFEAKIQFNSSWKLLHKKRQPHKKWAQSNIEIFSNIVYNSHGQPQATSEQPQTTEESIYDSQLISPSFRMSNVTSASKWPWLASSDLISASTLFSNTCS